MKTIVKTLGVYFAAGLAMQMGMEMIKKENKAKFTPKKYRKNN